MPGAHPGLRPQHEHIAQISARGCPTFDKLSPNAA